MSSSWVSNVLLPRTKHLCILTLLINAPTDLSMPVMDGITAATEIRKFEWENKWPRTNIIALTGLASASSKLEALGCGIDDYLTKPVNFGKLLKLLPSRPN
jgi:CheY-like chemotaxis protein